MRVLILTSQTPWTRYFNDFSPILKWHGYLKECGYDFKFTNSSSKISRSSSKFLWIDYRWITNNYVGRCEVKSEQEDFIKQLLKWKKNYEFIYMFDSGDSTGSRCFWLTPYVDVHLKKQLFQDKNRYLSHEMKMNYMVWLPDNIIESVFKDQKDYVGCRADDLEKLQLSWNLGYTDFRLLPLKKFLPTFIWNQNIFKKIGSKSPDLHRELNVSYRGGTVSGWDEYNHQRFKVRNLLHQLSESRDGIIVGGKVKLKVYKNEGRNSKVMISPFGFGEICYRDFETFINGALLVKPDMSHLTTFPNVYKNNITYIPVDWELVNFIEKLEQILENYSKFIDVAIEGQQQFLNLINDFDLFKNHLSIILKG
jgi:hypothetical protein